jgi:hypothetical protein
MSRSRTGKMLDIAAVFTEGPRSSWDLTKVEEEKGG